jgi:phosphatidylglycerol:prolipoprotein diacylglycerol transferase
VIPELFRLGPLAISPFGVTMVLGFLAARWQLQWGLRRLGSGGAEEANALTLNAGLWGLIGAKLYYAVLHRDFRLSLDWLRSGLVWYGGLLLGGVAVLWTVRRLRLDPWKAVDAAAPAVALGYACGRVGCFLVGDDYGMPTTLPWGIAFPHGLPAPTTAAFMRQAYGANLPPDVPAEALVRVHPTQLYETLAGLAIWALGCWWIRRQPRRGAVALPVLSLLAAERFAVEFLRAKDDRFFGGLTVAQLVSLGLIVLFAVLWRRPRDGGARA